MVAFACIVVDLLLGCAKLVSFVNTFILNPRWRQWRGMQYGKLS